MLAGYLMGRRPPTPYTPRVLVTVVNVGHGEASWIRTPGGKFILIGAGPPGSGSAVVESLRGAGARRIDLLILPYPYEEVIGGVPEVLEEFPLRGAWDSGYKLQNYENVNDMQGQVESMLAARNIPLQAVRAGQKFPIDGVNIEVLAPAEPLLTAKPGSVNNSVVVKVTFGSTAFLFAGGLERAGEMALLARAPEIAAEWLRVPRFGSREATSPELLRQVRPSIAVVSAGKVNAGGYPHQETLERLKASGASVYLTSESEGNITFESNGYQIITP